MKIPHPNITVPKGNAVLPQPSVPCLPLSPSADYRPVPPTGFGLRLSSTAFAAPVAITLAYPLPFLAPSRTTRDHNARVSFGFSSPCRAPDLTFWVTAGPKWFIR